MRKPLVVLGVSFLLISLLLCSCQDLEGVGEIDEVNWNAEFAVPVAHGVLSLQDLLDEMDDLSFLEIDNDGNMQIVFEGDPVSKYSTELFGTLPDFPVVIPGNPMMIPFPDYGAMTVDQIVLKAGTLSFEIISSHTEEVDITIRIPSLERNGTAFATSTKVEYDGSLPARGIIEPIGLDGYVLNVANGAIEVEYSAMVNGQPVEVDLVVGEASNWTYRTVVGNWEQERFSLAQDSVEIDFYDNWVEGDLSFADPQMTLTVENSFGFPCQAVIHSLLVRTADNRIIPLESAALADGINLDFPTLTEQGQSKATTFKLNRNNSNIVDILNARPTSIIYVVDAIINPNGSMATGFIDDQSNISVTLDVEIPVYGTANNFTIESSSEFEMDDLDKVKSAEFKLITDNGIPAELDLQIYFEDANEQIIDSLFIIPYDLIGAATVNSNGDVTNSTQRTDLIDISPSRIELLEQAERVLMHASFSTSNDGQEAVRILSTQELDIRMGLKVATE